MTDPAQQDPTAARPHAWPLVLLLACGSWVVLDDVYDAPVLKASVCALVAALVVVPWLAWAQRDAVGAWFGSSAARLLVLAGAAATPAALAVLDRAAVTDRLLALGLVQVAAVAGLVAAQRCPRWLTGALVVASVPGALVAWAQGLGWETTLNVGSGEVVGLSGNTMRAGAALALGAAALAASLVGTGGEHGRRWWRLALLVLVLGALVLTRARGARHALVAAAALAALAAWVRHERRPGRPVVEVLCALLLALLGALAVGGEDALSARKLDDQAPILSGRDPTTGVRLALFDTARGMAADHPLGGVGLGRFAEHADAYRDPEEAARPGLAGAATLAHHPHNEFLLAWAEGGWPALLLLTLAMLLTLRRAWRGALESPRKAPRVALWVIVTGLVLACVQDPWMDPATALPFFAAVGFVWSPRPEETRAWVEVPKPVTVLAMVMGLGLGLMGWPRLDVQLSLRSFYQQSDARGAITTNAWGALLHAGAVGPGDPVPHQLLLEFAPLYLGQVEDSQDKAEVVLQIERARERLAALGLEPPVVSAPRGATSASAAGGPLDGDPTGDDTGVFELEIGGQAFPLAGMLGEEIHVSWHCAGADCRPAQAPLRGRAAGIGEVLGADDGFGPALVAAIEALGDRPGMQPVVSALLDAPLVVTDLSLDVIPGPAGQVVVDHAAFGFRVAFEPPVQVGGQRLSGYGVVFSQRAGGRSRLLPRPIPAD